MKKILSALILFCLSFALHAEGTDSVPRTNSLNHLVNVSAAHCWADPCDSWDDSWDEDLDLAAGNITLSCAAGPYRHYRHPIKFNDSDIHVFSSFHEFNEYAEHAKTVTISAADISECRLFDGLSDRFGNEISLEPANPYTGFVLRPQKNKEVLSQVNYKALILACHGDKLFYFVPMTHGHEVVYFCLYADIDKFFENRLLNLAHDSMFSLADYHFLISNDGTSINLAVISSLASLILLIILAATLPRYLKRKYFPESIS